MFKRPSIRYGRTPEPETPYQKAAQVWDERIGSARVQARNWRLFVIGAQGGAELVNYRVRGSHMIVDRLFAAAELRLGADPQQVVRIGRTDGRPAS